MNSRILWRWGLGVGVAALLFGGGGTQQASSQAANLGSNALEPEADATALATASANEEVSMAEQADEAALATAAVRPISTEKPLPTSINLTGPVAEVVKLAESGVDESVMMAFVTNSTSLFHLGVEEVIYLNDIGVPGSVVTAMIQRDVALKGLIGGAEPLPAATEPSPPAQYAPQADTALAPPELAPEGPPTWDNAIVDYPPPPPTDTGYATFYDSLAPYGTWVYVAGYGPCWQPTVVVANPTWRPYCDGGHWVYSDCGWYWMSGYSWGWAPFHYGRWFRHNRLGWCWAPDTVWGPSWVGWRYGGRYCGWAPLPPGAWYRPGVGLTYHGRRVSGTFGFGLSANSFAFVDVSHFRNSHLNRHALPPQQAARVYNQTQGSTMIVESNRRVVNHGIPVSRVAEATGTEIHRVAIRDANSAARPGARSDRFEGDSRTLSVYRPHFSQPRSAAPLILRGPDRPGYGTSGGSAGVARGALPRPVANQRQQPVTTADEATSALQEPSRSAPRATAQPVRSESPRQYMAPSYQAPAQPRWSAPAPDPAPQPRPSFSPPPAPSTPRMQPLESRPSYSAPSAPATPAPDSRAQPSSDRRGR